MYAMRTCTHPIRPVYMYTPRFAHVCTHMFAAVYACLNAMAPVPTVLNPVRAMRACGNGIGVERGVNGKGPGRAGADGMECGIGEWERGWDVVFWDWPSTK